MSTIVVYKRTDEDWGQSYSLGVEQHPYDRSAFSLGIVPASCHNLDPTAVRFDLMSHRLVEVRLAPIREEATDPEGWRVLIAGEGKTRVEYDFPLNREDKARELFFKLVEQPYVNHEVIKLMAAQCESHMYTNRQLITR